MYFRVIYWLTLALLCSAASKSNDYSSIRYKIYEVIGNDTMRSGGTGGAASVATLNAPHTIWKDSLGTVYVGESHSNCIRKFSFPSGIVSVVAGVCNVLPDRKSSANILTGSATSAAIAISSLAVDLKGVVYLAANTLNRIIAVHSDRKSAFAGIGGNKEDSGDGGAATFASIQSPIGLWVDTLNQVYVSTAYNTVRKINTHGTISTVAGASVKTFDECVDRYDQPSRVTFSGDSGAATCAQFNVVKYLSVDTVGSLYLSDTYNYRVRKVGASGIIKTIAGAGDMTNAGAAVVEYCRDSLPGTSCNMMTPHGIAVDPRSGNVFIATESHYSQRQNRIYSLSAAKGLMTVVAGREHTQQHQLSVRRGLLSKSPQEGQVCSGCFDGSGGPATAALITPRALFLDKEGRLFASTHGRVVVMYQDAAATAAAQKETGKAAVSPVATASGAAVKSATKGASSAAAAAVKTIVAKPVEPRKDSQNVTSVTVPLNSTVAMTNAEPAAQSQGSSELAASPATSSSLSMAQILSVGLVVAVVAFSAFRILKKARR